MVEQLGKLVNVDPRNVWANEASNFTPWLRDNIDYLAEAVGIDIQLVESEVAVGDFSVDLVGEEPGQSRPVIIENQLGRTDHNHLGQLLTYAAGKDGGVIIWVSPEIRSEHKRALEWLNDATRGNLDFFGVELEVLQIVGSDLKAPSFKVVVGPKGETEKITALTSVSSGTPNERQARYQSYFRALLEVIKEQQPGLTRRKKVNFDSWIGIGAGRAGFFFNFAFTSVGKYRIEVYLDSTDKLRNKKAFDLLQVSKPEVESQLGIGLDWDRLDNRKASRISWYYEQPVTIMENDESLEELRSWTIQTFIRLREVLLPYIQNLEISTEEEYEEEIDEGP